MFQKIHRSTWKREEYFNHDLLHQHHWNHHEEFRMALNDQGEVGVYDELLPRYTVFHKESETVSNIWTAHYEDYATFCAAYEQDIWEYGNMERMLAKSNVPYNNFPVSMIPWSSFQGFNLNLQKGYDYLLPIFTIGKFEMIDNRCLLPLAVQVHHAVCDGFHLSRFINELQEMVNHI